MIKCTECGAILNPQKITRRFARNGRTYKIYVDAYVCSKCGEVVYPTQEAKRIERIVAE